LADAVDSYQDSVDKKQEFKKKADKEKQNKMLMKTQYGESRDGMVRAAAKQGREDAEAEVIDDIKESNLVPEFLKKRILAA
jgi:predicted double-glycine peptidase